jgi:ABC-type Fe3+ transport system permease subunit
MRILLLLGSGAIYLAAIVWPAIALVWASIDQEFAPRDGFAFSYGQFALLGYTLGLALAAALLCIPLGVAVGVLMSSGRCHPLMAAALAAGLLCPPMVYAFGWLRIFPPSVAGEVRCVMVWVLWTWPIAALVIGAGWIRAGKNPFHAARLSTNSLSAFFHVGLPALRPFIFMAAILLFVLFFGDYGVPHAFGLRVYSTELLGWATASNRAIDVLWPGLLPIAVTAIALAFLLIAMKKRHAGEAEISEPAEGGPGWKAAGVLLVGAGWTLPVIALIKPLTAQVFGETLQTYGRDLAASIGVAAAAAGLIMLLGFGFSSSGRSHKSLLFVALLFGALPGAVIGQALIAGYNRPPFEWLYDHWPILTLAYVARYAWIGMLACGFAASSMGNAVAEQARIDGASESQVLRYVLWPQHRPLLLGVSAIIVALAVGDVAASSLVRVPGYSPIALLILDKFHQFQDGMLISLSLMLVGISAFGAAAVAVAWAVGESTSKKT